MRACSWLPPVVQRVRLRRTLWRLDEMSSDILRSVTSCQSVLSLDRTYGDVNLREIRDSNRPDRNTIGRSMQSRSESPALTVRKGRLERARAGNESRVRCCRCLWSCYRVHTSRDSMLAAGRPKPSGIPVSWSLPGVPMLPTEAYFASWLRL
jgi:hypothetical protein